MKTTPRTLFMLTPKPRGLRDTTAVRKMLWGFLWGDFVCLQSLLSCVKVYTENNDVVSMRVILKKLGNGSRPSHLNGFLHVQCIACWKKNYCKIIKYKLCLTCFQVQAKFFSFFLFYCILDSDALLSKKKKKKKWTMIFTLYTGHFSISAWLAFTASQRFEPDSSYPQFLFIWNTHLQKENLQSP